jgi:DNA-3-methyladenine glycosylase
MGMKQNVLPRDFYASDTVKVARGLLGKRLVRIKGKDRMVGRIVEVEAYRGSRDPASHAYHGLTPRNAPMFGEAGHAYIYFTYGNHYCLNITTQHVGTPGAVLIRAIEPLEGLRAMRRLRPKVHDSNLTNGPGKLTKALGINKSLNKTDMTKRRSLFVEESDRPVPGIRRSARVGISQGKDRLWRFYVAGNPCVSRH